jgi:hypothetical protein
LIAVPLGEGQPYDTYGRVALIALIAKLIERLQEAVDGSEPKRQRLWADEDSSDGEAEFKFD